MQPANTLCRFWRNHKFLLHDNRAKHTFVYQLQAEIEMLWNGKKNYSLKTTNVFSKNIQLDSAYHSLQQRG